MGIDRKQNGHISIRKRFIDTVVNDVKSTRQSVLHVRSYDIYDITLLYSPYKFHKMMLFSRHVLGFS